MDTATDNKPDVLAATVTIVAAFVGQNHLLPADLPSLISSVHFALADVAAGKPAEPETPEPIPAVPVKKSVAKDFIVCLEDGKKFKSLKRHLSTVYKMTPDEYRTKWGLPKDYPMVCSDYSETRSKLAKNIGLGQRPAAEPAKVEQPKPAAKAKAVKSPVKTETAPPSKTAPKTDAPKPSKPSPKAAEPAPKPGAADPAPSADPAVVKDAA